MQKNYLILILSFVFGLALWMYINLNSSYSIDLIIPVEIQSSKSQVNRLTESNKGNPDC